MYVRKVGDWLIIFCTGIDAVKEALRASISIGTEEIPIKINLIAPPV